MADAGDVRRLALAFSNEILVGRAVADFRDRVVLATKLGFDLANSAPGSLGLNSRPDNIRKVAGNSPDGRRRRCSPAAGDPVKRGSFWSGGTNVRCCDSGTGHSRAYGY